MQVVATSSGGLTEADFDERAKQFLLMFPQVLALSAHRLPLYRFPAKLKPLVTCCPLKPCSFAGVVVHCLAGIGPKVYGPCSESARVCDGSPEEDTTGAVYTLMMGALQAPHHTSC